jgi:DNA-binding LacI/PurR family transcriptional regulator
VRLGRRHDNACVSNCHRYFSPGVPEIVPSYCSGYRTDSVKEKLESFAETLDKITTGKYNTALRKYLSNTMMSKDALKTSSPGRRIDPAAAAATGGGAGHPARVTGGRVTLKDIARQAGVSVTTASLVLAGKGAARRISREVETRVREVAAARDYAPNLLVRSLQDGRTQILSFYSAFGHRERDDLYMDRVSTAVERAAGARGYDVLVHCDVSRSVEDTYQRLNGGRADGLLFFGPYQDDPLLPLLRTSRLPTVLLNHQDPEGVLSSVLDDMHGGMKAVADNLVSRGHRRIAAIANVPGFRSDAPYRIAALREFLGREGIEIPERWIIPLYREAPHTPESALRLLLAEPAPPTALFCWHDRVGYEILEACERLSIRVPGDLSVVGYDGIHWPSTARNVLASVEVPLDTLAEAAVALLDSLIVRTETPEPTGPSLVQQVFPVTFSPGDTLAPAVRHAPTHERGSHATSPFPNPG